jgi:hypothetical protein
MLALAVLALMLVAPAGHGADLDRTAVDFKTPADMGHGRLPISSPRVRSIR